MRKKQINHLNTPETNKEPPELPTHNSLATSLQEALEKVEKMRSVLRKREEALNEDLREIDRLESEARNVQKAIERIRNQTIVENIDIFLEITPLHIKHRRELCSDEKMSNVESCTRCALLYMKRHDWAIDDFKFELMMETDIKEGWPGEWEK